MSTQMQVPRRYFCFSMTTEQLVSQIIFHIGSRPESVRVRYKRTSHLVTDPPMTASQLNDRSELGACSCDKRVEDSEVMVAYGDSEKVVGVDVERYVGGG